jgi:transposase
MLYPATSATAVISATGLNSYLWEIIESILAEHDPPKPTGRPRVDQRGALDAVIFRMRSGCQWNQMPKEFPDDTSTALSRDGSSLACWR